MKRLSFFLLLVVTFFIFSCNTGTGPGGRKPAAVILIPTASDTAGVESGIDAVPAGNVIRVEWRQHPDELVTAFRVYRSQEEENFTLAATVTAPDTAWEDAGVQPYQRYYYYAQALTADGIGSDPSDTLSYQLLYKADHLQVGGGDTSRPEFSWEDPNQPQAGFYCIRVVDESSQEPVWICMVQSTYSGGREKIQYNSNGTARQADLTSEKDYRWRIDVVGSEAYSGSESLWQSFTVQ